MVLLCHEAADFRFDVALMMLNLMHFVFAILTTLGWLFFSFIYRFF